MPGKGWSLFAFVARSAAREPAARSGDPFPNLKSQTLNQGRNARLLVRHVLAPSEQLPANLRGNCERGILVKHKHHVAL